MTWVMWDLTSFSLETVLVSVQDRSTVCAKRSIGSEIILDALMVLLGDMSHTESHFGPFRDSVSISVR